MRRGWWIAAALAATAASAGAAAPPARRADPGSAAARYRAALAPIRDCDAFFRHANRLPDATPLLRALFAGGVPARAAGEDGGAFVGRVVQRLFARLGDPSRLATAVAIAADGRYDAATGTMAISLALPLNTTLDSWTQPQREPGGRMPSTRTELRAGFDFPAGAVPRPIVVAMTPAEAARFAAGGGRMRILSLMQDYGTGSDPAAPQADGARAYRLVRLAPKCAMLVNGDAPLAGWRFDGWAAAARAE